jgi:hypothetical protein
MAAFFHRVGKDEKILIIIKKMMIVMMVMMMIIIIIIIIEAKHKAQIIHIAEYQNTSTKKTKV